MESIFVEYLGFTQHIEKRNKIHFSSAMRETHTKRTYTLFANNVFRIMLWRSPERRKRRMKETTITSNIIQPSVFVCARQEMMMNRLCSRGCDPVHNAYNMES